MWFCCCWLDVHSYYHNELSCILCSKSSSLHRKLKQIKMNSDLCERDQECVSIFTTQHVVIQHIWQLFLNSVSEKFKSCSVFSPVFFVLLLVCDLYTWRWSYNDSLWKSVAQVGTHTPTHLHHVYHIMTVHWPPTAAATAKQQISHKVVK